MTPHYNENGKQLFTSPFTVCFFFALGLASLMVAGRNIIPLFSTATMETDFKRAFLSNSLGYCGNKTLDEEMSWFDRAFAEYVMPKRSNFMAYDF